MLDVGTGTGAIALALAARAPDARVTATDVSPDALALARENADRARARGRASSRATCSTGVDGPFDLVVSNPPYVLAAELDALEPEVRDWEPRARARRRGPDRAARRRGARALLDGWLVLEVHEGRPARSRRARAPPGTPECEGHAATSPAATGSWRGDGGRAG